MRPCASRPCGLGRDRKLVKTDEFSSVFRFKQVRRGLCLDLHVMPNTLGQARLGLAVPRRVVRLSCGRNRLKRLMRELFRVRHGELRALDIIARVKRNCPEDDFRADFLRLLCACRSPEATVVDNTPAKPSTTLWIPNA